MNQAFGFTVLHIQIISLIEQLDSQHGYALWAILVRTVYSLMLYASIVTYVSLNEHQCVACIIYTEHLIRCNLFDMHSYVSPVIQVILILYIREGTG